jgi:hypothetical protein
MQVIFVGKIIGGIKKLLQLLMGELAHAFLLFGRD